ncbi:MAG: hypothetical protein Q9164_005605 [Protoblastenia rupestris]
MTLRNHLAQSNAAACGKGLKPSNPTHPSHERGNLYTAHPPFHAADDSTTRTLQTLHAAADTTYEESYRRHVQGEVSREPRNVSLKLSERFRRLNGQKPRIVLSKLRTIDRRDDGNIEPVEAICDRTSDASAEERGIDIRELPPPSLFKDESRRLGSGVPVLAGDDRRPDQCKLPGLGRAAGKGPERCPQPPVVGEYRVCSAEAETAVRKQWRAGKTENEELHRLSARAEAFKQSSILAARYRRQVIEAHCVSRAAWDKTLPGHSQELDPEEWLQRMLGETERFKQELEALEHRGRQWMQATTASHTMPGQSNRRGRQLLSKPASDALHSVAQPHCGQHPKMELEQDISKMSLAENSMIKSACTTIIILCASCILIGHIMACISSKGLGC